MQATFEMEGVVVRFGDVLRLKPSRCDSPGEPSAGGASPDIRSMFLGCEYDVGWGVVLIGHSEEELECIEDDGDAFETLEVTTFAMGTWWEKDPDYA